MKTSRIDSLRFDNRKKDKKEEKNQNPSQHYTTYAEKKIWTISRFHRLETVTYVSLWKSSEARSTVVGRNLPVNGLSTLILRTLRKHLSDEGS